MTDTGTENQTAVFDHHGLAEMISASPGAGFIPMLLRPGPTRTSAKAAQIARIRIPRITYIRSTRALCLNHGSRIGMPNAFVPEDRATAQLSLLERTMTGRPSANGRPSAVQSSADDFG